MCCAACICVKAVEGSTEAACRDPNTYSSDRHFDKNNFSHYGKQVAASVATASSIVWFDSPLKFRLVMGSAASSAVQLICLDSPSVSALLGLPKLAIAR